MLRGAGSSDSMRRGRRRLAVPFLVAASVLLVQYGQNFQPVCKGW
jgi:hypothetical protein